MQNSSPFNKDELLKRTLSASVLLLVAFIFLWQGGELFRYASLVISGILLYEWWNLLKRAKFNFVWWFLALVHSSIPFLFFGSIRETPNGFWACVFLLYIVILTDIGAFFIGRLYGKKKLAPTISPNKTWGGAIGGFVLAILGGIECYLYAFFFELPIAVTFWHFFFGAAVLSAFCQFGDLFESWAKRIHNVKDSGSIIAGHGGLLDRVDGLLFATLPMAYFLI